MYAQFHDELKLLYVYNGIRCYEDKSNFFFQVATDFEFSTSRCDIFISCSEIRVVMASILLVTQCT